MATTDDARLAAAMSEVLDEGTRDLFRQLLRCGLQELIEPS